MPCAYDRESDSVLPFTSGQFFAVFADYNRELWPLALAWWVGCAGALVAAWRAPAVRSAWLTGLLAALWVWNAVVYHAWFFTRINPAAWLFAVLFGVQAAALAWTALRGRVQYFSSTRAERRLGEALTLYALAYPFLTIGFGHQYPAAPTFGVPCPTDILTIGLMLTVRGGVALWLAIIPILWGFIGGSAALFLGVPTDYALLAAGVALAGVQASRTFAGSAR
jgi:hypothetical protein